MKTMKYMALLCMLVAMSGCSDTPTSSTSRSDYYTRGIGVYPGSPQEDFSPELLPGGNEYRNLAWMRAAYQSSSYDYNLTAQLLTDGILTNQSPHYLQLSTPNGEMPKREREWMIDGGPYSRNTVRGEDSYFQFSLRNYAERITRATVTGTLVYDDKTATEGYEVRWEASLDGKDWVTLDVHQGKELPGKASSNHVQVNDPNKQTDASVTMSARQLSECFTFRQAEAYSYYRIRLRMKGAYEWIFHEIAFENEQGPVDLKPSKCFTSAWMSATKGTEWVYVDLGVRSTLDKVVLHWVNKAVEGKIQLSDDALTWTDAALLPGGANLTDEVPVKGNARYVRVWMETPPIMKITY